MTPLRLLVVEDYLASLELMVEVFRSLKAEVHPVRDRLLQTSAGHSIENRIYSRNETLHAPHLL